MYLSVQPRLNAKDRCKSDFILPVDIFQEARRGLSDKYLLRSQQLSPPLSTEPKLFNTIPTQFLLTHIPCYNLTELRNDSIPQNETP